MSELATFHELNNILNMMTPKVGFQNDRNEIHLPSRYIDLLSTMYPTEATSYIYVPRTLIGLKVVECRLTERIHTDVDCPVNKIPDSILGEEEAEQ